MGIGFALQPIASSGEPPPASHYLFNHWLEADEKSEEEQEQEWFIRRDVYAIITV